MSRGSSVVSVVHSIINLCAGYDEMRNCTKENKSFYWLADFLFLFLQSAVHYV